MSYHRLEEIDKARAQADLDILNEIIPFVFVLRGSGIATVRQFRDWFRLRDFFLKQDNHKIKWYIEKRLKDIRRRIFIFQVSLLQHNRSYLR